MTDELQPCPFCWCFGEERLFELSARFGAVHTAYIHCTKCEADGPYIHSEHGEPVAIKRAREAWNARAAAPADTKTGDLFGG